MWCHIIIDIYIYIYIYTHVFWLALVWLSCLPYAVPVENIEELAESQYTSVQASKSGPALKAVQKISKNLVAYMEGAGPHCCEPTAMRPSVNSNREAPKQHKLYFCSQQVRTGNVCPAAAACFARAFSSNNGTSLSLYHIVLHWSMIIYYIIVYTTNILYLYHIWYVLLYTIYYIQ